MGLINDKLYCSSKKYFYIQIRLSTAAKYQVPLDPVSKLRGCMPTIRRSIFNAKFIWEWLLAGPASLTVHRARALVQYTYM